MKTTYRIQDIFNSWQVVKYWEAKFINKLKEKGFFVYAAEAGGEDYRKVSYADKVCLIIGSEGFGVSQLVKKNSDLIISIPMKGKVNSLNASVSAGILIFGIGE